MKMARANRKEPYTMNPKGRENAVFYWSRKERGVTEKSVRSANGHNTGL
jgi:hypothetical protein